MSKSVFFNPVPGLAGIVDLNPNRPGLFPADKKKKNLPPPIAENTPETYSAITVEITEVLRRAAAHDSGEVAVEIFRDERLPAALRGMIVPATVRMEIETFPGRVVREQGLAVYLSPDAMLREKKRRGYPVRCSVMPVRRFLELAGENNFGARFMTETHRFDLTRTQFNYIRSGAASLYREEKERRADEEAAILDAWEAEQARLRSLGAEDPESRRRHFFLPLLDVIAAVNAELPDTRRQDYAADFLLQNDGSRQAVMAEALEDGEMPRRLWGSYMPRISQISEGRRERNVVTVYLTDDTLSVKNEEAGTRIRCFPCSGVELTDMAVRRGCGVRLISAEKELILPFELLRRKLAEARGKRDADPGGRAG